MSVIRVLANPARCEILRAVIALQLTDLTGLLRSMGHDHRRNCKERQAARRHLRVLVQSGLLIASPGERQKILYRFNREQFTFVIDLLNDPTF